MRLSKKEIKIVTDLSHDLKQLEQKVIARKNQVIRYLTLAEKALNQLGRVVSREESSDHTKVKIELSVFYGFNLRGTFGMTYCGGNEIEIDLITYPKPSVAPRPVRVFQVYWQVSFDECEVEHFHDDEEKFGYWQKKMDELSADPDKAITEYKKKKENQSALETAKDKKVREEKLYREHLLAEAERLGLKI